MRSSIFIRTFGLQAIAIFGASGCATAPAISSFSGHYTPNLAASTFLAGEEAPQGLRMVIRDDGEQLETVQSYIGPRGEAVRLVWRGSCDGRERPIEGALPPGMSLSCIRTEDGAIINRIYGAGWSYSERCEMAQPDRLTCAGEILDAGGAEQRFVYAFDKQQSVAFDCGSLMCDAKTEYCRREHVAAAEPENASRGERCVKLPRPSCEDDAASGICSGSERTGLFLDVYARSSQR